MKLSVLIAQAQALIEEHGDLEVVCVSYEEVSFGSIVNELRLAGKEDARDDYGMYAGDDAALDIG